MAPSHFPPLAMPTSQPLLYYTLCFSSRLVPFSAMSCYLLDDPVPVVVRFTPEIPYHVLYPVTCSLSYRRFLSPSTPILYWIFPSPRKSHLPSVYSRNPLAFLPRFLPSSNTSSPSSHSHPRRPIARGSWSGREEITGKNVGGVTKVFKSGPALLRAVPSPD